MSRADFPIEIRRAGIDFEGTLEVGERLTDLSTAAADGPESAEDQQFAAETG